MADPSRPPQGVSKSEATQSSTPREAEEKSAAVTHGSAALSKAGEPRRSVSPTPQAISVRAASPTTFPPSLDYRIEAHESGPSFQSEIGSYFPENSNVQAPGNSSPPATPIPGAQTAQSVVDELYDELWRATQAPPMPVPNISPPSAAFPHEEENPTLFYNERSHLPKNDGSADIPPPHDEPRSPSELSDSAAPAPGMPVPSIAAPSIPIPFISVTSDSAGGQPAIKNEAGNVEEGDAMHTARSGKEDGGNVGSQSKPAFPQTPVAASTSASAPALASASALTVPPKSMGVSPKPGAAQEEQKTVPATRSQVVEMPRPQPAAPPTATPISTANKKLQRKGEVAARAAMDLEAIPTRPHMHGNPTQMDTQYVNMMLALDDISILYNVFASFFAWILLAGFVLFPGTFSNLQMISAKAGTGTVTKDVIDRVTQLPLFIVAWVCTGIGALGGLWLWWRWRKNYIFALNKIFLPGLMNSLAGVLSTLSSVFGAQHGQFSATSKITIIVTGGSTVIFCVLTAFYALWLVRRVKARHDRNVGKQKAGKYGEGKVDVSSFNEGSLITTTKSESQWMTVYSK